MVCAVRGHYFDRRPEVQLLSYGFIATAVAIGGLSYLLWLMMHGKAK